MKSKEVAAQHVVDVDGVMRIAPIVAGRVKFGKIVTNAAVPGILMNK